LIEVSRSIFGYLEVSTSFKEIYIGKKVEIKIVYRVKPLLQAIAINP